MMRRMFTLKHYKQPQANPRADIIQRWVETADERCPLACVWFALPETIEEQDDEAGLLWPVFSALMGRQAIFSPWIFFRHPMSI